MPRVASATRGTSFWDEGILALMLTGMATFRSRNYHRPTDTPDTLDYRRLVAVAVATALSWPAGGAG